MGDTLARIARMHEFRLLLATLALAAGLTIATDTFLTAQNLFDLLTANAFAGILAAGLLVVLVAGGIDISFTATASVAQYLAMTAANAWGLDWAGVFAIGIGFDFAVVQVFRSGGRGFACVFCIFGGFDTFAPAHGFRFVFFGLAVIRRAIGTGLGSGFFLFVVAMPILLFFGAVHLHLFDHHPRLPRNNPFSIVAVGCE